MLTGDKQTKPMACNTDTDKNVTETYSVNT